jgi:methanogenic corrinoid protein MtbC1
MNSFTIKDLEILSGIKAHTIRIWEQRYSFLKPQRSDTNIRYYNNEELKEILNVALLNKYGFKISHISNMNREEVREKILFLNQSDAENEKAITKLIQLMIDLDMDRFESVLNKIIRQNGINTAILQILFPFLQRIGILWQTGNINPSQEHLVTNLIRQKIIFGIDQALPEKVSQNSVLLFLPEGEHHELGLLFVHYLLKCRGVRTFYIGANVPLKDLPQIIECKNPDYLFSHITSLHLHNGFEKFISKLKTMLNQSKLIISGTQAQNYQKQVPENILLKKSFQEVNQFIFSL